MMNVKPLPAILILALISIMLLVVAAVSQKDEVEVTESTEPNEPSSILEIGTEIWACTLCGKIYHNYKEIIEHPCETKEEWKISYDEPEPNEPKVFQRGDIKITCTMYGCDGTCIICKPPESKESVKYSLPIPTWPDYIELEKDLIVDISNRARKPTDKTWTFVKGTKIYFKDDD